MKAMLAAEKQAGLPKASLMAVRLAFTGLLSPEEIAELRGMGRSRVVEWIQRGDAGAQEQAQRGRETG